MLSMTREEDVKALADSIQKKLEELLLRDDFDEKKKAVILDDLLRILDDNEKSKAGEIWASTSRSTK